LAAGLVASAARSSSALERSITDLVRDIGCPAQTIVNTARTTVAAANEITGPADDPASGAHDLASRVQEARGGAHDPYTSTQWAISSAPGASSAADPSPRSARHGTDQELV
jgi:hypothetical protein